MEIREKFVKLSVFAAVVFAMTQHFGLNEQISVIVTAVSEQLAGFFHLPLWFVIFLLSTTFTYVVYTFSLRGLRWMVPALWLFVCIWLVLYYAGIIPAIEKILGVSTHEMGSFE